MNILHTPFSSIIFMGNYTYYILQHCYLMLMLHEIIDISCMYTTNKLFITIGIWNKLFSVTYFLISQMHFLEHVCKKRLFFLLFKRSRHLMLKILKLFNVAFNHINESCSLNWYNNVNTNNAKYSLIALGYHVSVLLIQTFMLL